jgi:hypothetical protein
MDIDELRILIRETLDKKIAQIIAERSVPPKSFGSFKTLVEEAICDVSPYDQMSFEDIYSLWENVTLESDSIKEWNESLCYYVERLPLSENVSSAVISKLRR